MSNEEEIWKVYPEYDFIEASNLGRVRTKDRYVRGRNGSKRLIKGRILKQWDNGHGYLVVKFRVNGKLVYRLVHRIVAITFIPNPNGYPEVNHLDNDPTNNTISNLSWCTREQNIDYREEYGIALNRSVIAINRETYKVLCFKSQSEAGRQLGILQSYISRMIKGEIQKTHGFWFCRADKNAIEKARSKFGDEVAEKIEKLINRKNF